MAVLLFPTVLILIFTGIWLFISRRRKFFKLRSDIGIGGEPPHFFLGNLKQIIERKNQKGYDDSYNHLDELHAQFGETIGVYLGCQLNLHVTNEEMIKEIFIKKFSNFSDRAMLKVFEAGYLSHSLLEASYENGWKRIRSAVAPAFSTSKMKLMHDTIESKISTFLEIIDEKTQVGVPFDIYEDLQALTLDVIGKCAFAVDGNCQRDRNDVFYVQARKFITNTDIRHSPIITQSLLLPELDPLWKIIYPFTNLFSSEKTLVDGLTRVYEKRVDNCKIDENRIDLLKLLIDRQTEENHKAISKEEVIENAFAFLLAGYETTSTALTYCTYLLAKHQDVQQRLYEEIIEARDTKGLGYDTIHSLPYMDAVFKESLRVYPPVIHFINRVTLEDTEINGTLFPKGSVVCVVPHNVHMNEKNWPNAKKFDPERFLDWNEKGSFKWIPFGVGPRICVGMRFAEMEFKTAIVRMLEKFQLIIPDNCPELIPDCTGVIMRPMNPVYIKFVNRSN